MLGPADPATSCFEADCLSHRVRLHAGDFHGLRVLLHSKVRTRLTVLRVTDMSLAPHGLIERGLHFTQRLTNLKALHMIFAPNCIFKDSTLGQQPPEVQYVPTDICSELRTLVLDARHARSLACVPVLGLRYASGQAEQLNALAFDAAVISLEQLPHALKQMTVTRGAVVMSSGAQPDQIMLEVMTLFAVRVKCPVFSHVCCSELVSLSCTCTEFTSVALHQFCSVLRSAAKLTSLELEKCKLVNGHALPLLDLKDLSQLKHLELVSMPSKFVLPCSATQLRSLSLTCVALETFSAAGMKMSKLSLASLDLDNNLLTHVPTSISVLSALTKLSLANQQVDMQVPEVLHTIASMPRLQLVLMKQSRGHAWHAQSRQNLAETEILISQAASIVKLKYQ